VHRIDWNSSCKVTHLLVVSWQQHTRYCYRKHQKHKEKVRGASGARRRPNPQAPRACDRFHRRCCRRCRMGGASLPLLLGGSPHLVGDAGRGCHRRRSGRRRCLLDREGRRRQGRHQARPSYLPARISQLVVRCGTAGGRRAMRVEKSAGEVEASRGYLATHYEAETSPPGRTRICSAAQLLSPVMTSGEAPTAPGWPRP
jgi:hypothetical protein